ncbi:MAG: class I SAM-dependent methyltransferase [Deltaproteobacteria bacterium]|nr:class I SAM-dependent methyltransferase [Deltaproteobacteria bacterium]MBK9365272.1 class I SAM-dependent methyltransferase [Deltaproteobacteria bacterium]
MSEITYDGFAELYEAEFEGRDLDVLFYARRVEGARILVLGCGAGRVPRGLVGPGRDIVGLDLSAKMLELATQRGDGARYVLGDMRHLHAADLGDAPFDEVLIPNAAFNFLLTRGDQRACLEAVAKRLSPEGRLTLDMPMPDFALWATASAPERLAWEGVAEGRPVRRLRATTRDRAHQRLDLHDRYVSDDGETLHRAVLRLRLVLPNEAEWMMEGCGLYVEEMFGDYNQSPVSDTRPRLIVCARRAE